MGSVTLPLLLFRLILGLLISSTSISFPIASDDELSLVVSLNATLQVLPGLIVEKSPGSKPGTKVLCERVQIHGLSRLKHLKKFANSIKVKVSYMDPNSRAPNVQVCFHRNMSLGIGMCPQDQWEKLSKGVWSRSMSPFENKLLDLRLAGLAAEPLQVSLVEEFYLYRVVFLVLGTVLMTLASFLSQSLVFYYSGAMAVGVLLVVLMVLFQGMRLLPTGRKSSLAIFVYSSIVGLGSFLLRYVARLLQSVLTEIGIGEDMYNPLAIFVVVFLVIAGAWLGFWVVRKLVLTEDGDIDVGVSHFVAWSIRIFASVMILQSSLDPLLAIEALLCGILISSVLRRFGRLKFIHHLYRRLFRSVKSNRQKFQDPYDSPVQESHSPKPSSGASLTKIFLSNRWKFQDAYASPVQESHIPRPSSGASLTSIKGSSSKSPGQLSDSETFYSTFHTTPEQRKFSKDEWDKFTRESTKKAMEDLVSSPDFSKWAVAHADRITLAPKKDSSTESVHRWNWFNWF